MNFVKHILLLWKMMHAVQRWVNHQKREPFRALKFGWSTGYSITSLTLKSTYLPTYLQRHSSYLPIMLSTSACTSLPILFSKNGPNWPFLFMSLFSYSKYSTNTINDKSIDDVLGTQTRSGRMVGADESTELWQHPYLYFSR